MRDAQTYSDPVLRPRPVRRFVTRASRLIVGLVIALIVGLAIGLAQPAHAARDVVQNASNYGRAVTALDDDVALWRPTYTAGLRRKGPIDVIAYGKQAKRASFAGSTYGKRVPSFTIAQKNAADRWAARPVDRDSQGLVGTVSIRMGAPGSKRLVRARVYADCRDQRPETAGSGRCEQRDVARFGGSLVVLARTNDAGRPLVSDVRIDSQGLSFDQLLRIARGLVPVTP